jgi:3-hydroxyisobutyrate dehydrogenase-like beta-hydroxyacid dehydrogenase
MSPIVGIIAQGQMGSAVAKRLHENGLSVVTLLEGRSPESVARALGAGMKTVTPQEFCAADIILSIVPPGEAVNLARGLVPVLVTAPKKPVYVDCNAVNPETAERIGMIIETAGAAYVDAGIIGGPPKAGASGPTFYLSGAQSHVVAELNRFGLECKILAGQAGAASALKMSYAGITKGLTALASIMLLAATRAGTADALRQELALSQPALLAWFERQVPSMFGKAYRWVAEMEEVAGFVEQDAAGHALVGSTAELYRRLAADFVGAKIETDALEAFFGRSR